jgi:transposase InsO family protein
VNEFESINRARQQIEAWSIDYNEQRPHGALGQLTPSQFADAGRKAVPEAAELQLKTFREGLRLGIR